MTETSHSEIPTILDHPSHPDPDIVFMQPLRPGCWYHQCAEPRTTAMWLLFPLTMFVQGICDKHAAELPTRLEGYEERDYGGAAVSYANEALIDSLVRNVTNGTARNSDLVLPHPFPRNWPLHAMLVTLIGSWPSRSSCWMYPEEGDVPCPNEPQVSLVLFSLPASREKKLSHLIPVSEPARPMVQAICRGHSGGVYRILMEKQFFHYPQSSGGVIYRNPKCNFPFGTDPDDNGPAEKDVAA